MKRYRTPFFLLAILFLIAALHLSLLGSYTRELLDGLDRAEQAVQQKEEAEASLNDLADRLVRYSHYLSLTQSQEILSRLGELDQRIRLLGKRDDAETELLLELASLRRLVSEVLDFEQFSLSNLI